MKSALILAGGRGRRMGYKEKALLPVGNRTILEKTIEVLETVVDEVIVSVRDETQQEVLREYTHELDVVLDHHHDVGPLAGILEGLKSAGGEYVFISACDMPYLNARVVQLLFDRAQGHDAAIPAWGDDIMEPLHAVYRAGPMAVETEKSILRNGKIAKSLVFKLKDVVFVDMEEIRAIDPELKTFMNINTMEDISNFED